VWPQAVVKEVNTTGPEKESKPNPGRRRFRREAPLRKLMVGTCWFELLAETVVPRQTMTRDHLRFYGK